MPRKTLTYKQKLFVKKYVENGGNGTQAALKVYNTTDNPTARDIASTNLANPHINKSIEETAKGLGITHSTIIDKFHSISNKEVQKWSGDTVLKATVEMARVLGMYPGSKHSNLNITLKGNVKELNFTEAKERLKSIDDKLQKLLQQDEQPITVDTTPLASE